MNVKLSHSSANRFQTCPQEWKFHYQERLRPTVQSAALLFGTAVDRGVMQILHDHKQNLVTTGSGKEAFLRAWTIQEDFSKDLIPRCIDIVYANSDYDEELLTEEDLAQIKQDIGVEDPVYAIKIVYEVKQSKGFDGLNDDDKKLLNLANWLSLKHKGLLMMEAFKSKVLPKITEVLDSQTYVELKNDAGDKIIGYADMVVRYEGYDKPIVLDLKTSSREYARDAVLTSPQLALYVHSLYEQHETRLAGFVVMSKHIKKNRKKTCSLCSNDGTGKRHKTCDAESAGIRCNGSWTEVIEPEAVVEVMIDEIPSRMENMVMDNMDSIAKLIKYGVFIRNLSACDRPWGPCAFKGLCHKGSMEGLRKEPERE
jgi:PD-(D/E)XK nuclease superfamily